MSCELLPFEDTICVGGRALPKRPAARPYPAARAPAGKGGRRVRTVRPKRARKHMQRRERVTHLDGRQIMAPPASRKWTVAAAYSFLKQRQCPTCQQLQREYREKHGKAKWKRLPAVTRSHFYKCYQHAGVGEGEDGEGGKGGKGGEDERRQPATRRGAPLVKAASGLKTLYFQCPYRDCQALLCGPKLLCLHMAEYHRDETFCPRCKQVFGSPVHCRAHVVQHHPDYVESRVDEFIALTSYYQAHNPIRDAIGLISADVTPWISNSYPPRPVRRQGSAEQEAQGVQVQQVPEIDAQTLEARMQEAMDASDEEALVQICSESVPISAHQPVPRAPQLDQPPALRSAITVGPYGTGFFGQCYDPTSTSATLASQEWDEDESYSYTDGGPSHDAIPKAQGERPTVHLVAV